MRKPSVASQVRGSLHIPAPMPSLNVMLKQALDDQVQFDSWERPLPITWRKPRARRSINGVWCVVVKYTDPKTLSTRTLEGIGLSFSEAWLHMRLKLNAVECLP